MFHWTRDRGFWTLALVIVGWLTIGVGLARYLGAGTFLIVVGVGFLGGVGWRVVWELLWLGMIAKPPEQTSTVPGATSQLDLTAIRRLNDQLKGRVK